MFKKLMTALLAAALMMSAAACAKDDTPDSDSDTTVSEDTTTVPETPAVYTDTLDALLEGIYGKVTLEMDLSEAMPIDLTNENSLTYYLGLTDATGIDEAIFSEPFIGSIPFSLCLVRTTEDADVDALKDSIKNGVNTRKWVCVEANNLVVDECGGVILMIMTNPEYGETLSQDIDQAFLDVVNASLS